jgi:hemerythrin-like domain-containing protein
MDSPVETLMKEHRVIERVLGALAVFAGRIAEGNEDVRHTAAQFAEFFQSFADRCHHGKEEDLLFKELEKQGMPAGAGPIGVMLKEHEEGRACVREIASIGDGNGPLSHTEQDRLHQAISEYVPLLQAHIQKEDHVLFPMADRLLSQELKENLSQQFEQFEREHIGKGVHDELHALAESLVDQYRS